MIRLSREIRFALVPPDSNVGQKAGNSWAGWPSINLVMPQLVLAAEIEGELESNTGYLCNIKVIDDLLRKIVLEDLVPNQDQFWSAERMLLTVHRRFRDQWSHSAHLAKLTLQLSPYLRYSILEDSKMSQSVNSTAENNSRVNVTYQFEFSAAHRLNCASLSNKENVELFGKCNNPEGHGHNYVIEVTLANDVQTETGQVVELAQFESTVKSLVIDRLDHKHLNRDVEYFAEVNPSVENIAIAIYGWLEGQFGDADLVDVKVFETPKTWAQYAG